METLIARPRTMADGEVLARARACIVEHGPRVSLTTLSRAIGLSPPALVKRFGSKARLVFRALLPPRPPRWPALLHRTPGHDPAGVLRELLVELCHDFVEVGPALAALRMSDVDVSDVFPAEAGSPSVAVRQALQQWLREAGVHGDLEAVADAAVGAAEARGFLRWFGPHFVEEPSDERWATRLAAALIDGAHG